MADHPSLAQGDDESAAREHPAGADRPRPASVAWVARALGAEALVLVGLAVVGVVDLVRDGTESVGVSLALVVAGLLVAWLLAACARGLAAGRSWVRGPAVTVQILALLTALSFAQGGLRALPAAIGSVAGLTFVGLVLPAVTAHTRREVLPFDEED